MSYTLKSREDIENFLAKEIVSTGEARVILNCSRQYLNQLVKEGKLNPIREMIGERLFLRSEIEARIKK